MSGARATRCIAALLLLTSFGCASGRRPAGSPLQPLAAASAEAAWESLDATRRSLTGISSYATVRVPVSERSRSFRARLALDRTGAFELAAFTPLGTGAFTAFAKGGELLFLDHVNRTWWRGEVSRLLELLELPPTLAVADLALFVFGLPPDGERDSGAFRYFVAPSGLQRVEPVDGGWRLDHDPPAFPPQRAVISRGDDPATVTITHHDVTGLGATLATPAVPSGYRCCAEPRLPTTDQ